MWVVVWLVLGAPLLGLGHAGALVVAGYGMFSVGETVLAPVLSPLAATLAPEGAAGRTLAAVSGAQNLALATGPALSGLLLGLGLPAGLVALQLAICLVAIGCARRLGRVDAERHREAVALAA
jgi:MFS family permease